MKTYRKPNEQLFRWPLSYLNLTKNTKTYIRRQQHKNFKHQDIKQKEPPQMFFHARFLEWDFLSDWAIFLIIASLYLQILNAVSQTELSRDLTLWNELSCTIP